jgi:tetratricopeptide (TPR) repeat protein
MISKKNGWLAVFVLSLSTGACGEWEPDRCGETFDSGSYEEAVRLCEAAHHASGDPRAGATAAKALGKLGEDDRALAWFERLRGTTAEPGLWSVAASVYHRRGERERASQAFRHDLKLLAVAGDPAGLATAHHGLFYLAWEESRYRDALEEARLSFTTAGAAGDRTLQSRAAVDLYTVLYALGDLDGAGQALALADRLLPPERTTERARLLANQGSLRLEARQPALARQDIERALELMQGGGNPRTLRSMHLNLVQACIDRGDLDGAGRHLELAWQSAEEGSPETSLLYARAQVERARGRSREAAQALDQALADDPVADWAWELEVERGQLAEESGDLLEAERAYERSAALVEEMRGSLGLDELKAWLLDDRREPFEALFLLQARSGRSLEALATVERAKARTFQDAFVHATLPEPAAARDLWSLAADRADTLRDLLPAMSESPSVALVPVERALAAVGERRLLVYFEAGDEIWLLDVTGSRAGGRVRPHPLGPAERVRDLVDRSLAAPDDLAIAAGLGDLLLPAGLALPPGETLHVVPDGALTRVSFASLRRRGRWLVQDHAILHVPGVSFLASTLSRGPAGAGPPVVLADPRSDLPQAAAEGREVAARLGTAPRLGPAATSGALLSASGARVLHVAGHAGWGAGGPWLELADRRIAPATVLSSRLRPGLVVLASCASASASGRTLWGSPGAAFLAAGSGAVLASLGSVEDRAARELVLRFYREGGVDDPAGGLARAQRALLATGRPPSSWAPFVLLGAGSTHSAHSARSN